MNVIKGGIRWLRLTGDSRLFMQISRLPCLDTKQRRWIRSPRLRTLAKEQSIRFSPNKEQLFDQILVEVIQEMKNIAHREVHQESAFFDNLFRVLDALLEFRRDHDLLVKLSQELKDFGTLQAKEGLDKVEKVISDFLAKELEKAKDNGEIRDCDPQVVAL